MRPAGPDAVTVLRWGLRRYRVLFAACLLFGGVLAPLLDVQHTLPADAEAVVIARQLDMDLDALPRYGQAVFDNGEVARTISATFGDTGDFAAIVPNRVSLIAEQNSIVFGVVGHDPDPETAAAIANAAADTFIEALNAAGVGVGSFALQSPAEAPAAEDKGIGTIFAAPLGVGSGLVLGLAAVCLLLIARRPVLDAASAEEATGVPALGLVTVPRTRGDEQPRPEDVAGLVPVCRRLLRLSTPTAVLVSRPYEERVRQQVGSALGSLLARVRDTRLVPATEPAGAVGRPPVTDGPLDPSNGHQPRHGPTVTLVDGTETSDLIPPPDTTVTVLVVPVGIGSTALHTAVSEHLGGSAEARLLLATYGRGARGLRRDPLAAAPGLPGMPNAGTPDQS
ncbi:hypothetical protein SAMN05660690_1213 [Geodermatophilus telluris]|uniref:Capsular polysaccharide biosynthesis protein n=2 Tax=Geodermatophilus telluris TaxID=1190417 RepID=A0A1G6L638_9ACTN|nr:hypothetical protein SAMN05660690_1213 [Geodermatophilus telluris]